jgi:predicted ribosomally synthesized peptide with nif11-like leader
MSKENLEQFMKQVADSKELQAKIGEEITEDALVALGAAHGCEFSIEDVQASAELSDAQMEGVAGGLSRGTSVFQDRMIKYRSEIASRTAPPDPGVRETGECVDER